ncbi:nitrogen fixation protein NifW [Azoarcus indigens]|uniref:Nitrogenase-stabilizing/protective protein NifW n=1 Tax=Azoarcus indigens TaxID=29545 RepID=A0A4R6E681_9RHOO|nr:nitrogenase-stabilizing/protective protein NifW [Azoarcus indigens]NMG65431.1 nitrogen fixation protein NifW [Azoarcus indigens]TDN53403.1 nitrogenase-stabilizing/protective protein [Azoarcus indigens]
MDELTLDEAMEELSSAEDFLNYFGVDYDPAVVHVNRLHILQRFHDYLAHNAPEADDEDTVRAHNKRFLELAYQDFTVSDAVTEKVFAVFKKASGTAFVSLGDVKR